MSRAEVAAAFEALDAARAAVAALPFDAMTGPDLLALYERRVRASRQDAALDHMVLAHVQESFRPEAYGNTALKMVLATRLHLDSADAHRRLSAASMLGPRWSPTGEPLPPQWTHTAAELAAGGIDPAHVEVIRRFFAKLPGWVDAVSRADAERDLAAWAHTMTPGDLRQVADHLAEALDPDGAEPNHDEQQRRRSLRMGKQQPNGMTHIDGELDPEAAALLDVVLATYGAPGHNLPADPGAAEVAERDIHGIADPRTTDQRHHDAIKAALREVVGSEALGRRHGRPATIVVTTSLGELETAARDRQAATGYATTTTGTKLPMRDVIRLAGQGAHHYLTVFDDHTEEILYFGRARRCASPAQWLALFARDRGCTRPGCTAPADRCQAHHAHQDWKAGGTTDITAMALACQPDNNLIEQSAWTTRRRGGRTEWVPPASLDTGQTRVNRHHHPRRYLTERDDEAEPA